MEESEKRRERLKAMRIEAAGAGVNDSESSGLPSSHALSNPLIESENATTNTSQYISPRFDYYTDPMSAFSGSRRRTNIAPQVSQGHHNAPPRLAYQGMTPPPFYQNPAVNSPGQRMFQGPGPHFNQGPLASPIERFGRPQGNPRSAWGGSRGSFNYNPPPNVNYDRGRAQRYNTGSHYDSGRGRGRSQGMSSSPGSSGGRGGGPCGPISAELRPDLYYSKEMVEDPWKPLNPVIWKGPAHDSDKHWLPKSIGTKKPKVSPEASQTSISQPSLAEYLAASFKEAVDDEGGT